MNYTSRILCYNSLNTLLGVCPITKYDDTTIQYFIESFMNAKSYGKNPNGINESVYAEVRSTYSDGILEVINRLIALATDLNTDGDVRIIPGAFFRLSSNSSAGEFFFIKVPYGTTYVVDINDQTTQVPVNSTYTDAMVMISSKNTDLTFGEGLITTRSEIVAENGGELSSRSYIANYLSQSQVINLFRPYIRNGSVIKSLETDNYFTKDNTARYDDYSKSWKLGDTITYNNITYTCISSVTTDTDFPTSLNWSIL